MKLLFKEKSMYTTNHKADDAQARWRLNGAIIVGQNLSPLTDLSQQF